MLLACIYSVINLFVTGYYLLMRRVKRIGILQEKVEKPLCHIPKGKEKKIVTKEHLSPLRVNRGVLLQLLGLLAKHLQ